MLSRLEIQKNIKNQDKNKRKSLKITERGILNDDLDQKTKLKNIIFRHKSKFKLKNVYHEMQKADVSNIQVNSERKSIVKNFSENKRASLLKKVLDVK